MRIISIKTLITVCSLVMGCDAKNARSLSLLPDANIYAQDGIYEPRKIDVLWIIDNSGSMQTSQQNLTDHFSSFIEKFHTLRFDYHLAVGATDSWKTLFNPSLTHSQLRDGSDVTGHSGIRIINKDTTNIVSTFTTNALLGINGTGDERAFQSLQAVLENPSNSDFRRQDAFLAIIILSDEDDFSHDSPTFNYSNYNDPSLHSVDHYIRFLDNYTQRQNSTQPANYSISTITVTDDACRAQLDQDGFSRYPGVRYMELVRATGGSIGSLCESFDNTLATISDSIVNYSSIFPLTRQPLVDTIRIQVDGNIVLESEVDGWTYRATDNSIWFHGSAIPPAGSRIRIDFDPVTIKL